MRTLTHRFLGISPWAALFAALAVAGCLGGPTASTAERAIFEVNGVRYNTKAYANLHTASGAPDSLYFEFSRDDILVRVRVEYVGVGTYVLGPDQVVVWVLLGGDVITGTYGGSAVTPGELLISKAGSVGTQVEATFFMDLDHATGMAAFGTTATVRKGTLRATLE